MENRGGLLESIQGLLDQVLCDVFRQVGCRWVVLPAPLSTVEASVICCRDFNSASYPLVSRADLQKPFVLNRLPPFPICLSRNLQADLLLKTPPRVLRIHFGVPDGLPRAVGNFVNQWRLLHHSARPGEFDIFSRKHATGASVLNQCIALAVVHITHEFGLLSASLMRSVTDHVCRLTQIGSSGVHRRLAGLYAALADEGNTGRCYELENQPHFPATVQRGIEHLPTITDCELLAMLVNRLCSEFEIRPLDSQGQRCQFLNRGCYPLSDLFPARSRARASVKWEINERGRALRWSELCDEAWCEDMKSRRREAQMFYWRLKAGTASGWTIEALSLDTEGFDENYGLPNCLASDIYSVKYHLGYQLFENETLLSKYNYAFFKCNERLAITRHSVEISFVVRSYLSTFGGSSDIGSSQAPTIEDSCKSTSPPTAKDGPQQVEMEETSDLQSACVSQDQEVPAEATKRQEGSSESSHLPSRSAPSISSGSEDETWKEPVAPPPHVEEVPSRLQTDQSKGTFPGAHPHPVGDPPPPQRETGTSLTMAKQTKSQSPHDADDAVVVASSNLRRLPSSAELGCEAPPAKKRKVTSNEDNCRSERCHQADDIEPPQKRLSLKSLRDHQPSNLPSQSPIKMHYSLLSPPRNDSRRKFQKALENFTPAANQGIRLAAQPRPNVLKPALNAHCSTVPFADLSLTQGSVESNGSSALLLPDETYHVLATPEMPPAPDQIDRIKAEHQFTDQADHGLAAPSLEVLPMSDEPVTATLETVEVQYLTKEGVWEVGETFMRAPQACVGKTLYSIFAFGVRGLDEEFLAQYSPSVFWNLHWLAQMNRKSFHDNVVLCLKAFENDKHEYAGSKFQQRGRILAQEYITHHTRSRRTRRVSRLIDECELPGFPRAESEPLAIADNVLAADPVPEPCAEPRISEEQLEYQRQEQEYTRQIIRSTLTRVNVYYSKNRPMRYFVPTRVRHKACIVHECPLRRAAKPSGDDSVVGESFDQLVASGLAAIHSFSEGQIVVDLDETKDLTHSEHWSACFGLEELDLSSSDPGSAATRGVDKAIYAIVRMDPDRREDLMTAPRMVMPHPLERFAKLRKLIEACLASAEQREMVSDLVAQLDELEKDNLVRAAASQRVSLSAERSVIGLRRRKPVSQDQLLDADGFPTRHVLGASNMVRDLMMEIACLNDSHAPVVVGVNEKGRGIYAAATIYKGDFVCEYKGDIHHTSALVKACERKWELSNRGSYIFCYKHPDNGQLVGVDATEEKTHFGWARLVNHSHLHPNLEISLVRIRECPGENHSKSGGRFALTFKAARDIRIGEELLIDYGERRKPILDKNPWLLNT